ncbi:hypothetical protein SFRURICE_016169, partial [Spodoptera frugiperda]
MSMSLVDCTVGAVAGQLAATQGVGFDSRTEQLFMILSLIDNIAPCHRPVPSIPDTIPDSYVLQPITNITLPGPGIESETPCSAVAHTATRP